MKEFIRFMKNSHVESYAVLPFSSCRVTRAYLYEREENFRPCSVLVFLIPYYAGETENLSVYAASRDYHLFMKTFESALLEALRSDFPENRFLPFSDHSPIDERDAAARAGLGVICDNGLLLTERYSSFVFLGEVLSDVSPESFGLPLPDEKIGHCLHCGACAAACPTGILRHAGNDCLSAITQKKGELTEEETAMMRKYHTVWGCDICQNICPYTRKAKAGGTIETPIPFFHEDRVTRLDEDYLLSLNDKEFAERAFSWRGREVPLRNVRAVKKP